MAPPLSPAEARVVDAVLTNHSRGYVHPERVAHHLFPAVTVNQRGGRRIEFNKDSFKLYNTVRAAGGKRQEVEFGFLGQKFALEQHDLVGKLPVEVQEEAARGPGIDLGRSTVESVQDIISLSKEVQSATLARDAAKYAASNKVTLAGSDQWTHADSDPKTVVKEGKEAIRAKIGRYPNTMVLGPLAFSALDDHPKLMEKIKYTSSDSITLAMIAKYFDVQKVVRGDAVYADDEDEFVDVWGNDVVLAYVPMGTRINEPSYGYTYQLAGHPFVGKAWYDDDFKSWKYPVTDEFSPELVGAEAGYLIKDAV